MNYFYVYEWIRLDTNEPFYVGKGKGDRAFKLHKNRNKYFKNIVKKVPTAVVILEKDLPESIAFEFEVFYIEKYRNIGYELTNITAGGEGISLTTDIKKKISESHKGKRASEKSKLKNKLAHIGKRTGCSNNKSRKIVCLNNRSEFSCIREAKSLYGKIDIQACCCGNKTYAGINENKEKMVWSYYEDFINMSYKDIEYKLNNVFNGHIGSLNHKSKKVKCITTGKIFDSARQAGLFYNLKTFSHITSCCKGKRSFCGKLNDGTKLEWSYF